MGYSPNYGPLAFIDYIAAPHIQGYQDWTLILGNLFILPLTGFPNRVLVFLPGLTMAETRKTGARGVIIYSF